MLSHRYVSLYIITWDRAHLAGPWLWTGIHGAGSLSTIIPPPGPVLHPQPPSPPCTPGTCSHNLLYDPVLMTCPAWRGWVGWGHKIVGVKSGSGYAGSGVDGPETPAAAPHTDWMDRNLKLTSTTELSPLPARKLYRDTIMAHLMPKVSSPEFWRLSSYRTSKGGKEWQKDSNTERAGRQKTGRQKGEKGI